MDLTFLIQNYGSTGYLIINDDYEYDNSGRLKKVLYFSDQKIKYEMGYYYDKVRNDYVINR